MGQGGGRVVLVGVATAVVVVATSLVALAPVAVSAPPSLVAAGARAPIPPGSTQLGRLAAGTPLRLRVVLEPRDPAALAAFAADVSTPGNALYRRYLARGEFAGRFGPAASTLTAVRQALSRLALSVGDVSSDHLILRVDTTALGAERAFHVSLERYRLPGGRTVFANTAPPLLPAGIARHVLAVVGLDDVATAVPAPAGSARAQARGDGARSGAAAVHGRRTRAASPSSAGPKACTAAVDDGAATAGTLASAYGLTNLYAKGDLGAGETVGLFESGAFSVANVATYQKCYGTHTVVKKVNVDGGVAVGEGTLEATADVEDLIGLAPHATLLVYQTANVFDPNWLDEWTRIVDDDAAQVVSTSWLACESLPGSSYLASENLVFEQAAAQGQTVVAAAGDYGSEGCDQFGGSHALTVDDPASQPFVTGVGGTQWPSGLSRSGETTWDASQGAGGGGLSSVWPMPSWQKGPGVRNTYSSGKPCHATSGDCREVPDISALAGAPFYGFYCTAGDCSTVGGWGYFWGTSFATPLLAAAVALADESCAAPPVGFANPALYDLAADGRSPFHDITTGNNDFTKDHGKDYPATKGYDLATGLGTPMDGAASGPSLAAGLCSLDTPTSIQLGGGAAAVVTSNKTALSLGVSVSETFTGLVPSVSLKVSLAHSASGSTETHTWIFPLPASDLSERGGDVTVTSGHALGGFGSVTLKFTKKKASALSCTRGSGTVDSGTLAGAVSFNTYSGTHGWGEVSEAHLALKSPDTLTVDDGCSARTSTPSCVTEIAWSLTTAAADWVGASTTASEISVRTTTKLASPKGAVREEEVTAPAPAPPTTTSGGHTLLHVAGKPGTPVTGSAVITSGSSTTRDSSCVLGGTTHKQVVVTYDGTVAEGSPKLTASFSAPSMAVVAGTGAASFVVMSVH